MTAALIVTAGLACAGTAVALLLLANLTLGNKKIDFRVQEVVAVSDPQFVRTIGFLLNAPVLPGNRVEALPNGDAFFPAMLAAIRGAQQTITFETYIYWSGTIGAEFAEAFMERARAGVRVHVLIDWWGGEDILERYRGPMEAAGVEIGVYNPLRITALARMNNRTHRKLLVVDGRIGFTGGAGIADAWRGDAQDPQHWRDTHYRVNGPVVSQLQSAFMDNWMSVSGRLLNGTAYFPDIEATGPHAAQVFTSAPGGGAESAQLLYLMSIAAARRSIRLSMAYFVPDDVAVATLVAARRRGVRVQIILPGPQVDRPVVQRASRFEWEPLLEAGVEIHEYQPTMYHCKVLIVDGLWTSVGSTNFDNRSFSVNDEANLNIHSAEFAHAQERLFEEDLTRSRQVNLSEWKKRSWSDKLLDALAGTLSSQL
jgi:cardiolipin synthase A/B